MSGGVVDTIIATKAFFSTGFPIRKKGKVCTESSILRYTFPSNEQTYVRFIWLKLFPTTAAEMEQQTDQTTIGQPVDIQQTSNRHPADI